MDEVGFRIPLHFEELDAQSVRGISEADLQSIRRQSFDDLLEADGHIEFAAKHAMVSRFMNADPSVRESIVKSVQDFSTRAIRADDRSSLKQALFLLAGLLAIAENDSAVSARKQWDKQWRVCVVECITSLAMHSSVPSWSIACRDEFASHLVRSALGALESVSAARDKNIRKNLATILASAMSMHPPQALPACTGAVHLLNRFDHVSTPLAEILQLLATDHASDKLAADVVADIARLDPLQMARDSSAAKSCAQCLGELAERLPKVVQANLSLVLALLDTDAYLMRNGVLHAAAHLIQAVRDDDSATSTRDALLDILLNRAQRDVNAFTRSKALQVLGGLVAERALPTTFFVSAAAVAASRMEDRAAVVRKSATQLLVFLLRGNPFGPALTLSHFRSKKQLVESSVAPSESREGELSSDSKRDPADTAAHPEPVQNQGDEGAGSEDDQTVVDEAISKGDPLEEPEATADPSSAQDWSETSSKHSPESAEAAYYKSAVDFITTAEMGIQCIYQMIRSTSVTDVSEAVSLLVTAVQFQFECVAGGAVRAMLPLVFAKEAGIKSAAIGAYEELLTPHSERGVDTKEGAMIVTNGLIALILGASIGEVACLEALISELMAREASIISPSVVKIMWDIYAGRLANAPEGHVVAACVYVGMFAMAKPETLQTRVQTLDRVGLKSNNPRLVMWTCAALSKLPPESDTSAEISRALLQVVNADTGICTCEQALNAVFRLHPRPERDVADLIARLHKEVFDGGAHVAQLALLMFVVGHVAIKQLVRVEAYTSALRKAAAKDNEEEAGAEADKALEFAERELVAPRSLLGRYAPLIRRLSVDEKAPPSLRASAVLSLTKLMCVEESFCEANLQLLFTVLERGKEAMVRANAVAALGDLAFRFPNLLEPWSSRLYRALEDHDARVRKNALMALTHLILNDMVKIKGQIVGLSLRVLDDDYRISNLAKVFFHELSRKSANAIYNLLPDTVSCLSKRADVHRSQMKSIVAFLTGFIDKSWQAEGLVEKFCHRFRTAENDQELRDISYCILQLARTERCIGKLSDCFKLYASALVDDEVHSNLVAAAMRAKKAANHGTALAQGKAGRKGNSDHDGEQGFKHTAEELIQRMGSRRSRTSIANEENMPRNIPRVP